MSTTKEYRIRELERQSSRRAARLRSLEAGADRAMAGVLMLRNYTDNWDGPGGTTCSGNVTITATCQNVGVTTAVSGATITATNGTTTFIGTTNGSGAYTFAPGFTGPWTFTSVKSGFVTYSGSFTFACANLSVGAPMVTTSQTVTGTIYCSSQFGSNIPGVSVSIYNSSGGALLGSTTTDGSGAFSLSISGYTSHTVWLTYSIANYTAFAGSILLSCTGTRALGNLAMVPVSGKSCQCSGGLVADATTMYFSSTGYSATLTYNGTDAAYVGTLAVNCRAITGLACSKGTATVTLTIKYSPSSCALGVTFNRQGLSTPACTGTGGMDVPASDAWCATLTGLNQCTNLYGNGGSLSVSTTGYPFVATFTGVLFRDADSAAFLTDAVVSE